MPALLHLLLYNFVVAGPIYIEFEMSTDRIKTLRYVV